MADQYVESGSFRWVQYTVTLTLPMGIGLDEQNVVTEVNAEGVASLSGLEVDDELLWVDGIEVRGGVVPITDAIDSSLTQHLIVLRRMDEIRAATHQPTDGSWAQEIGPVELRLPMGIGVNKRHVILELSSTGSALHDGTLQVSAPLSNLAPTILFASLLFCCGRADRR